ncbi:hypothetical protein CBM2592_B100006 [Cupriavidus taiwanensis]|nr:hypothetical protein CBM2592_B100006 [Cupriavidus taiwanensis]SOY73705.1 hypothetical protein CBM2588_B90008 [Cupriavidus taiwanensis]SOY97791.1 hypothetical protein CBM2591_B80006 [Cupriavidus taiwanensis]
MRKGPWQGSRKSVDVMPGARPAARRGGRRRGGMRRLRHEAAAVEFCRIAMSALLRVAGAGWQESRGHLAFTRPAAGH